MSENDKQKLSIKNTEIESFYQLISSKLETFAKQNSDNKDLFKEISPQLTNQEKFMDL